MTKRKIVVCGATGSQGRAVVNALLTDVESDWEFLRALAEPDALRPIFEGAHGIFVMSTGNNGNGAPNAKAEREMLAGLVSASVAANPRHIVMTSVPIYGPRPVGVSFHDEKFDAEDKLRAAGAPVTILRLTSFMDNLTAPWGPMTQTKVPGLCSNAEAKVPWVAPEDIGRAAACCFARGPEKEAGKERLLCADVLTGAELAALLPRLRGYPMRYAGGLPTAVRLLLKLVLPDIPRSIDLFESTCLGEPYEKVWGPRYAVALAEMAQLLQEEAPAPLRGPPMSFEAYILKHNLHSAELAVAAITRKASAAGV